MFVAVCREDGPQWVCVSKGRLQPRQESRSSQTHFAHEGWRDQTYSNVPLLMKLGLLYPFSSILQMEEPPITVIPSFLCNYF